MPTASKTTAKKPPAAKRPKGPKLKTSPERIAKIIAGLQKAYPGATCALVHRNAWELLVATILSAQCTDARVNMVTPELFRRFPTPAAMSQSLATRTGRAHPHHRLLPQQGEVDLRRSKGSRRALRRQSPEDDG